MAQDKKRRNPIVTSPLGTWRYPKLTEPDYGTEQYPNPDGSYSVQLVLPKDSEEFASFMEQLKPHFDAAVALGKERFKELPIDQRKRYKQVTVQDPYRVIYDKETELPTGDVFFKIGMKASGEYKKGPKVGQRWNRVPVVFDASGKRMMPVPQIWSGTKGRLACELVPFFVSKDGSCGLSLRLSAAQVVDLVSASERSADQYGFGKEEGYRYEAPEKEPEVSDEEADAAENF